MDHPFASQARRPYGPENSESSLMRRFMNETPQGTVSNWFSWNTHPRVKHDDHVGLTIRSLGVQYASAPLNLDPAPPSPFFRSCEIPRTGENEKGKDSAPVDRYTTTSPVQAGAE